MSDPHDAPGHLSQEVLVKACRSLDSFRGASKPFTWLYRIAVNTYLNDYLRYQARSTLRTAALNGAPDARRR